MLVSQPVLKRVVLYLAFAILFTLQVSSASADTTPTPVQSASRFGDELAQAFNNRDDAALSRMVDIERLLHRMMSTIRSDPKEVAAMVGGARKTVSVDKLFGPMFKILDGTHGVVKNMPVPAGGAPRALLRFDLRDRGFDYLEFNLEKGATGMYRAVDWFQLSRGELFSVSAGALGRLMIDPDPGLLERLFGTASIDPNVIALFRKMGEAQRQGRFADALALSDQIPKPIAESRQMLTARASLAMQAEKMDDYERTLALLASKYSNDPEVAFALVDRYFFKHQTEKLVQTMATIENRVGADGITSLIKVSAYLDAQDFDKAIASGKEAIRLEPDYDRAYTTLALVYVQAKKYEDAVKVFTDVEKRFGVVFERKNLVENPALGEFIKSAAFKRWLPAGK